MLLLRAADEAHRRHAVAIAVERRLRGVAQLLVVGEAEIVVGAEVEHLLPAGHLDLGRLHGGDHPLGLVEAGGFQPVELGRRGGRGRPGSSIVSPVADDVLPLPDVQVHCKSDLWRRRRLGSRLPSAPSISAGYVAPNDRRGRGSSVHILFIG